MTWQSRNRHLIRSHHARRPSRRDRNRASNGAALGDGCGRWGEGQGPRSADRGAAKQLGQRPTISWRRLKPQAMADPVYDRIDVVTLTLAVVLAAGNVFLLAELVPQLVDLMMMPPPLSGAR
jgi:hypothetical protein